MVSLRDVWRRYRVPSPRRPRGLRASLSRDPLGRHRDEWFWALRSIDLDLRPGEAVALIGRNGAGKSTLLRLAGGVGRPDRGTVSVTGRVGALIDLGHEFHGELTGRQNAELAAVVAGMSRHEFRARAADIVDFAELAEFIDQPLRAYSDGMRARLAFSVVAHLDPDVLLVDEVLAVGDATFQRRSVDRIDHLRGRGAAVVFVSHDLGLVRRVCERAMWLDHGEIRAEGSATSVVDRYLEATTGPGDLQPPAARDDRRHIRAFRVRDDWGSTATSITCGDGLTVECDIDLPDASPGGWLRVRIVRTATDTTVVDTSTPVEGQRTMQVRFARLDLAPGDHRIEVCLFTTDWSTVLDEADPAPLAVRGEGPQTALLAPPHDWHRLAPGGDPQV